MPGNSVELEFQRIKDFLKLVGLREKEIRVYLLGLERNKISSGDIVNSLEISPQAASDIMRKLAAEGFSNPNPISIFNKALLIKFSVSISIWDSKNLSCFNASSHFPSFMRSEMFFISSFGSVSAISIIWQSV